MREPDRVRELLVGVDLGVERRAIAELHQVHDAPVAALQDALAIAGGLGGLDHLGRDVQALLDVLRRPQRDAAGVERGGERGGSPEARASSTASALSSSAPARSG